MQLLSAGVPRALPRPRDQRPPGAAARLPRPATPIEQALAYGVKVFGVTVHFVDEGVDSGPVILQRAIELPDAHRRRGGPRPRCAPLEHALLPEAVRLIARGAVALRSGQPAPGRDRSVVSGPRGGGIGQGHFAQPGEVRVARALLSVSDKTRHRRVRPRPERAGHRDRLDRRHGARARGGGDRRSARSTDFTGFPEIMDGRVKTLHPKLYAGLLAGRDDPRTSRPPPRSRGSSSSTSSA